MHRHTPAIAALTLAAALAGALIAGPLNPPAGPVASTYKTLSEVEPRTPLSQATTPGSASATFVISQPGSYYLTANLAGSAGKNGIEIAASDVTIDLRGFEVRGLATSLDGIVVTLSAQTNIKVHGGAFRGWGGNAIDLTLAANAVVRDVQVSGAGTTGIQTGEGAMVLSSSSRLGGAHGIVAGAGSRVADCIASDNTTDGISAGTYCTITGCNAFGNGSDGILGGAMSTMSGCTAQTNSGVGIGAGQGSTVIGCTSRGNSSTGIAAGPNCTITDCTSLGNSTSGISGGLGSTISRCTSGANTGNGIQVSSACIVLSNTCAGNGAGAGVGAGIHATGGDNRIEGNLCTNADTGIDLDAAFNIVLRNTCAGNTTNWSFVSNNIYGAIVDRTIQPGQPVSGNSATSSMATTDPHANITH